jgi:tetratricopeptide (TPR) repeat protein
MTMRREFFWKLGALILCSVWASMLGAQTSLPLQQLTAGDLRSVEASYADLQKRFESGAAGEVDLLNAYAAFYQRQDKYRAQLDAWIKAYPRSSAAHTARGVYLRRLGDTARGAGYIQSVPTENLRYMEQMHALAVADLTKALELNPKTYIATLHLLNIANTNGDDLKAFRYLNMGNEILPTNLLVRARYLIHLTPKWGGSWDEMETFIKQCEVNRVPPERIEQLRAIMFNELGRAAAEAGESAMAQKSYIEALRISLKHGHWFRDYYLKSSLRVCRDAAHVQQDYCKQPQ